MLRIQIQFAPVVLAISALTVGGCHRQGDANSVLAKAVKELERAEPAPPPAPVGAPVANAPAAQAAPTQPAVAAQPVAQQMNQALTSYKAGDYPDAIARLEWLRSQATKTPEQTMAIQDAMAAVMAELYVRAEKGDARAKQAIKQYNEARNKPR